MSSPVSRHQSVRAFLWRVFLRSARAIIWAADEWILKHERALRGESEKQEYLAAVDPVASAEREKVFRKARKPRASRPRLRYVGGQFVRSES
jgi:hypothetical protein